MSSESRQFSENVISGAQTFSLRNPWPQISATLILCRVLLWWVFVHKDWLHSSNKRWSKLGSVKETQMCPTTMPSEISIIWHKAHWKNNQNTTPFLLHVVLSYSTLDLHWWSSTDVLRPVSAQAICQLSITNSICMWNNSCSLHKLIDDFFFLCE